MTEAAAADCEHLLPTQIVVGCESDTCEDHHSVLLQYRKDAR